MSLDNFLTRGSEPAPASDEPREAPAAPQAEPAPEPTPEPETPAEAPKPEADEPEAEAEPKGVEAALADERAKRRDWKEKAIRAEEAAKAREKELEDIRRQLDELKRGSAPQQQPPQPPQQEYIPDPVQDPAGFVQYQQARQAEAEINTRLNLSEYYAREKYGAERVDAAVEDFKAAAAANPQLRQVLFSHPAPYDWLVQQAETVRMHREIGENPAAFKARMEAEIRERVLAEMQQQAQAPQRTAPHLPPSLANARSAAPRSAPIYSGPTPIGDIVRR